MKSLTESWQFKPRHAKSVFLPMRTARPRLACASAQSDQGFHCPPLTESLDTTESINGEQRLGWYCAHVQDNLNLCILRKSEGTFSLDAANLANGNNANKAPTPLLTLYMLQFFSDLGLRVVSDIIHTCTHGVQKMFFFYICGTTMIMLRPHDRHHATNGCLLQTVKNYKRLVLNGGTTWRSLITPAAICTHLSPVA